MNTANDTPSSTSYGSSTVTDFITRTINANQTHQYALTKYAERLTEELKEVDSLLKVAEHETQEDVLVNEDIQVMGAVTAKSPINPADLLKSESPFFEEATSRNRYINRIQYRPLKGKELDILVSAVSDELRRLRAIDYRNRGLGLPNKSEPVDLDGDTENVNWDIVAEKVSDVGSFKRMPDECQVKWLGHKRPRLNHSEWSDAELKKLYDIVKDSQKRGTVDWVEVAGALGTNRVPIDCMRNANARPHHIWTAEADEKLIEAVKLYGNNNWALCATYVSEHCTPSQCYGRYTRYLDPNIDRREWRKEEDEKLRATVALYGCAWKEVSRLIPGRTNEQCRERFTILNNTAAGKRAGTWEVEEDQKLLEGISIHGNKWKLVSAHMQNTRTHGQCRSRYATLQRAMGTTATSQDASSTAVSIPSTSKRRPTQTQTSSADFLVLRAPPTGDDLSNSGELHSKPSRKQPTKGKEKAEANMVSATTLDPSTTSVEMDIDASLVTAIHASHPKPRPKPKRTPNAAAAGMTTASTSVNAEETIVDPNLSGSGILSSREDEGNSDTQSMLTGTTVIRVGTRQSQRLADKKAAAAPDAKAHVCHNVP